MTALEYANKVWAAKDTAVMLMAVMHTLKVVSWRTFEGFKEQELAARHIKLV